MEHFYDNTGMTILILSQNCHGCTCMTKNATYCDKHVSSRKCIFFVVISEIIVGVILCCGRYLLASCLLEASGLRYSLKSYHYKKDTSVMIRVCHIRSRFLSCMYIHDDFMTKSR